MSLRFVALAIVLTGGMAGMAGTAEAAEDPATLDKLVQMNRKALDQLRVGQNAAARDGLLDALAVGKRAGLTGHQILARTHMHLGAVYLTGFGDRDKALRQFESAVKIKPNIQLTPAVLTPTVQEVFEIARTETVGAAIEAPPAVAAEGGPAPPPEPAPAAEPAPTPSPSPSLSQVDAPPKGRAGLRGRKSRPLTHAAAAEPPAPSAVAEGPDASVEAAVSAALEEEEEEAGQPGRLWVSLGIGSGVGFHLARPLESRPDYGVPTGFSMAALAHFAPEIGYRVSEKLAFSLQSRHQLVPRNGTVEMGPDARPGFAHAVFARAHFRLSQFGEKVAVWGTATAGGGSAIRLYVPANPARGLSSSDTVAAGPVALGPGISVIYQATPRLGAVAELRALVTVGGFAALADVNLGAAYSF